MLSKVYAAANTGFDSQVVEIECDLANGLPALVIVGLANKAIDEAKERIRGAIKNSGLNPPKKRVTLNLAPADLPKDGTAYDLAMTVAILTASGQVDQAALSKMMFVGELALDGSLRPIPGALAYTQTALENGFEFIFVPKKCAEEASLIGGIKVMGVSNLRQLYRHLVGEDAIKPQPKRKLDGIYQKPEHDLAHVYGQEQAKRALEIAAAGGHNLLLTGPPGAGKSMLAKSILSILPPPTFEETIAITKMHSLNGAHNYGIVYGRPFRSPHHTASDIALIGGGQNPKPGEISLAHHGVLFLDELPEFRRNVLEVLRQPLEDGHITVSRAKSSSTYPARFMLIATQNPCPCGYEGDPIRECSCSAAQVVNYSKKVSGPLLDRIDLVVPVQRVDHDKLLKRRGGESSKDVAARVQKARTRQYTRLDGITNAAMTNQDIKEYCELDSEAEALMKQALKTLDLSARAYMRVLKVARTIADLDSSDRVTTPHLTEALQYRGKR